MNRVSPFLVGLVFGTGLIVSGMTDPRKVLAFLDLAGAVDGRLILGSLSFGVGWGLVGLCPGPAIADLGFLDGRAALFVASMIIGMGIYRGLASLPASRPIAEASLDG